MEGDGKVGGEGRFVGRGWSRIVGFVGGMFFGFLE
jgi:hypothetical protein